MGAGSLWEPGGWIKNLKIFTFLLWPRLSVQPVIPLQLHRSHSPTVLCVSAGVCWCVHLRVSGLALCRANYVLVREPSPRPDLYRPAPSRPPSSSSTTSSSGRLLCTSPSLLSRKRRQHRLHRHFRSLRWFVPDIQFFLPASQGHAAPTAGVWLGRWSISFILKFPSSPCTR